VKVIDIIAAALGIPADEIRSALASAIASLGPDLAGGLVAIVAKFDEALTPVSIGSLVASLTPELTEALKLHFNPRDQPGNLA
jgi:hypothetical protein